MAFVWLILANQYTKSLGHPNCYMRLPWIALVSQQVRFVILGPKWLGIR